METHAERCDCGHQGRDILFHCCFPRVHENEDKTDKFQSCPLFGSNVRLAGSDLLTISPPGCFAEPSPRPTTAPSHGWRICAPACGEPRALGAEEHKPDHAQDQDRKSGRDAQKGEHRRPGLGLAGLGRGFDDLAMLSRCHGALYSLTPGRFLSVPASSEATPDTG